MSQFKQTREVPIDESGPTGKPTMLTAMPLAFPGIITPYGVAVFILLLSAAEPGRPIALFGVFMAVMVLDLLAMLYARPIVKYCLGPLIVLNSVLGVLQVALAVQMLIIAGQMLGVIPNSAR
jgi:multiple antibiotic resistance protein